MERLKEIDPLIPDVLNDRAQDNARAICAIADVAGGDWPKIIRNALVGLASQIDDEPQSAGVMLLHDIAEVLETRTDDKLGSQSLCSALCYLEDAAWSEWRRGSPITPRGIAKLLKPFGEDFTVNKDFTDALNRYLSDTPDLSITEKCNEINGYDACGACDASREGDEETCHKASLNVTNDPFSNWEVEL